MENSLSLYQIEASLAETLANIAENDGVVTPEQEIALAITRENLAVKLTTYSDVIKSINQEEELAKLEIARIERWLFKKKKLIESLETRMLSAVNEFGDYKGKEKAKSISSGTITFAVKKTAFVFINNQEDIPVEYMNNEIVIKPNQVDKVKILDFLLANKIAFTQSCSPDKTKIKNTINDGTIVPGADVLKKDSLNIK